MELLLEYNTPDHIFLSIDNNSTHYLNFRDVGAIGFFLTDNKEFYCDNSLTHTEMKEDYCAKHFGFASNNEYNDYVENPDNDSTTIEAMEEEYEAMYAEITGRGSSTIEGRFWKDYNVIAFWYNIPDFDDFRLIIDGLSDFLNKNLKLDDIRIALEQDVLPCSEIYKESVLVKNIDRENSEREKALHLMNAEEKVQTTQMKDYLRNRSEKLGKKLKLSNANKEMPMAQWRALHNTSENKNNRKKQIFEQKIKELVIEAINESKPYWKYEKMPRSSKENEIESSWEAFENTLGDIEGHIPTRISYPNSYERDEYEDKKYRKEDLLDADPYDDYPNAFTEYDDVMAGYNAMQCMSDNPLDSQYKKQHWTGRTDKDGNLVWNVDFDKVVENTLRKVKNKLFI